MKLWGLDFTSTPNRNKPLVLAEGRLVGKVLEVTDLRDITGAPTAPFSGWEAVLDSPGPWILATDVPLGMPRGLFEYVDWPRNSWREFVLQVGRLSRGEFRSLIESIKVPREDRSRSGAPPGATKMLRLKRATDLVAGSACPMNCVRPPVGLMFHEAVKRLAPRSLTVLPQDIWVRQDRMVIEAYSRLVVEALLGGRKPYKDDLGQPKSPIPSKAPGETVHSPPKSQLARAHRKLVLEAMTRAKPPAGTRSLESTYGFRLRLNHQHRAICLEDPTGDWFDSVLCLVQAGWSYRHRDETWGIPPGRDPLEGWIVDPKTREIG